MKKRIFAVFILLSVALVLRLYHIEEHTEFLGDQGSAGVIIYESFLNRTIPLVGPAVSTGQRPGPFFYYLIAPALILFNFNPVAPAIFFAGLSVITVLLLWYLGNKLYSFWIGIAIAGLWAVSPLVIVQGRTFWNPASIPILVTLLIFAFYKISREKRFWYFILIGFVDGALVQLHYSNIFTVVVSIIFWLTVIAANRKQKILKNILLWTLAGCVTFLATLGPFIFYEWRNTFVDVRSLLLMTLFPSVDKTLVVLAPVGPLELSYRAFWYLLPISKTWLMTASQLLIFLVVLLVRRVWSRGFVLWYVVGIGALSFYKGPLYDHYLYMLLPLPFLIFGAFLHVLKKHLPQTLLVVGAVALLLYQLGRTDVLSTGYNDIPRTQAITADMMRQADGKSFSFTLVSSRSFSDYHYRFFLRLSNVWPTDIESKTYPLLFLICDKAPCDAAEDVQRRDEITVYCYDHHCKSWYPHIFMNDWQLVTWKDIVNGRLYSFKRK